MRHGRRGRALNMDGHQSRPPHHKLSLPLASMRRGVAGTIKRLHVGHQRPPLPSHHQLPCGSMRSRASSRHMRMSHTGPNTHTPEGRGERGTGERTCSEPRRPPAHGQIESLLPKERMGLRSVNSRRRWCTADGALTRGHWATAAYSGDAQPHTHHTPHRTHTH